MTYLNVTMVTVYIAHRNLYNICDNHYFDQSYILYCMTLYVYVSSIICTNIHIVIVDIYYVYYFLIRLDAQSGRGVNDTVIFYRFHLVIFYRFVFTEQLIVVIHHHLSRASICTNIQLVLLLIQI